MKLRKILLIYVILLLVLAGCKKDSNQTAIKPKDKAPESLASLSKGIDDLLKTVGDIEKLSLDIPLEEVQKKKSEEDAKEEAQGEKSQGATQGGNGESGSSGSGNGESADGISDKRQPTQKSSGQKPTPLTPDKKKEDIDKKWNEAQKKIEDIHSHWNSFEAEGQKKGLTKESADAFEVSFNKMTKAIEDKKIIEVYDYASQSFLRLKPIYDLFTDDIGGDVSAIKYAAYQAYLRAVARDLVGASKVLTDRGENINLIRLKLEEDKKEKVDKVNLSLMDFKESFVENSRRLFMIKKDIIINNLKELEK